MAGQRLHNYCLIAKYKLLRNQDNREKRAFPLQVRAVQDLAPSMVPILLFFMPRFVYPESGAGDGLAE
jgi:hypothetical protein